MYIAAAHRTGRQEKVQRPYVPHDAKKIGEGGGGHILCRLNCSIPGPLTGTFRLDYEYEIEYEYEF